MNTIKAETITVEPVGGAIKREGMVTSPHGIRNILSGRLRKTKQPIMNEETTGKVGWGLLVGFVLGMLLGVVADNITAGIGFGIGFGLLGGILSEASVHHPAEHEEGGRLD